MGNPIKEFARGIKIIVKGRDGEGNQGDIRLARMSRIVYGQIDVYGTQAVRASVIKGIEGDLKRKAKKGGKEDVDAMIENALSTPEYMRLLHKLGMEEPHLRVMGMQVLKGVK